MSCRLTDLQDLAYGFLDEEAEGCVRDHLESCASCRESFERLDAEKDVLARAARRPAAAARWKTSLVPLGFAAGLLVGLFWLLAPRAPEPVAVTPARAEQEKQEKKAAPNKPVDEESLRAELKRLNEAFTQTSDLQEKSRIKNAINDVKIQLDRMSQGKETAEAKKPEKTVVKGKKEPGDDRVMKTKMELEGLYGKLKTEKDPEERMRLEKRIQELGQEMKLLDQGTKPSFNFKEAEVRLQKNPDDVEALVLRAGWLLDNGKAEPAMRDLNRAIELKSDCASAWLKRAVAFAMQGNFERAWKEVKHGESLDMKAGKEIDAALVAIKKLQGASKEGLKKPNADDMAQRIAVLGDRLEELRGMAANADLPEAERERARRDAQRVEAEIDRLKGDLKNLPAEPKIEKKK